MTNLEDTKITLDTVPEEPLLHELVDSKSVMRKKVITFSCIIIAGFVSGYFLFSFSRSSSFPGGTTQGTNSKAVKVVGSTDEKVFRDSAQGQLEEGGINGEGTHRLVRPGGENQTVYLNSSVLNLNDFAGKKVKVWGETFAAKKAGWLMDIGRVEVLE